MCRSDSAQRADGAFDGMSAPFYGFTIAAGHRSAQLRQLLWVVLAKDLGSLLKKLRVPVEAFHEAPGVDKLCRLFGIRAVRDEAVRWKAAVGKWHS